MEKLTKVLRKFEVEEFEVAEMVYAYLVEYGDEGDSDLLDELYGVIQREIR